jgi:hypothetical protein
MSKHNDIYNILGKLNSLAPKQESILKDLNEGVTPAAPGSLAERLQERYLAEKDMGKHNNATTGFKALAKKAGGGEKGEKIAGAQFQKMKKAGQLEEGGKPDFLDMDKDGDKKEPMKKAVADKKKNPFGNKKVSEGEMDEDMLSPKEKKFAKLAPPPDKVTYADKIAGAKKKDVDEGEYQDKVNKSKVPAFQRKAKGGDDWKLSTKDLDDEATKSPTSSAGLARRKKELGMNETALKDKADLAAKRKALDDLDKTPGADKAATKQRRADLEAEAKKKGLEEGFPTVADARKEAEKSKGTGKFDKKKTSTGTAYTRKADTFADGEEEAEKAPKKKKEERVTSKAWKHKDGRKKVKEAFNLSTFVEDTLAEMADLMVTEKAVSQAQQKFMGMVHATQKGEKAPSKEVAKVAKGMSKKDATDFASTKHKGLPKKVSESVLAEGNMSLKAIEHRYGKEVREFMDSGALDNDLYHALHDFYYDDMPASVKRGGQTQEWVGDKFFADMGGAAAQEDLGLEVVAQPHDRELDELASLAGLGEGCNHTREGVYCPQHGLKECSSGGMGMWESRFTDILEDEKAKKDYDGDGEVESGKDEYLGSKAKAAREAGKLEESGYCDACDRPAEKCKCDKEEVAEEFANEPDEQYLDTDTILDQGEDLNRKKKQFKHSYKQGDNPMAMPDSIKLESRLAALYNSLKVQKK